MSIATSIIATLSLLVFINAHADDLTTGTVAVEKQEDFSKSYKDRRSKHGALFSISTESFYPVDYRSLYNDAYIEDIIAENKIDLIGFELGYKYNFGVASASILGQYSQGSKSGSVSGASRSLKVVKQGLAANVALDGVFSEPWVVPYGQVGMHTFSIEEAKSTGSESSSAAIAFNYRYGLLFQIDWIENHIDKSAKADQLRSSGLENTFIDIYFASYLASSAAIDPAGAASDGDPNLFSSGEIGIGLKMEF